MSAWLGAMLVAASTATTSSSVERHALIIGHNRTFDNSRAPLRFADDDAARFYELLTPASQTAHLLTLLDKTSQATFPELVERAVPPSRENLERTIETLEKRLRAAKRTGKRAELFVFYAGHGDVADGEGYVHLVDGRLTRPEFQKLLSRLNADITHVIIDSCKSYYMVAGRGPGGSRERLSSFAGPTLDPSIGYVLSTSSDAEAHEWAAIRSGIFSHEVRSAFVGAADANANGKVSYAELDAFIATANEGVPYPAFRPKVFIRPPAAYRNAIIFHPVWLRPRTTLELPKNAAGRISIIDERGFRYADANKAPGKRLRLSLLQPSRYEVRWTDRVAMLEAKEGSVTIDSLALEEARVASRGEAHRAFEHLFSASFGEELVRGYRLAIAALVFD